MPAKGKGGTTAAAVAAIAQPIADEMGLKIWDICFAKEGATWFLRIFIDKPEGVSINDCEQFSRAIDEPLDELDPIEQSYCLEVSSPGIERELTKPAHFAQYLGARVMLRMIRPVNGVRDFKGTLESYDAGNITVRLDDGAGMCFEKKESSYVKLDDFDN